MEGQQMQVQEIEVPVHRIDRDIYGMPAFATLTVSDLAASRAWYASLGFVELAVMPPGQAEPYLVHLRRYRYQDLLLVPGEPDLVGGDAARISFAHTGPLEELDDVAGRLSDLGVGRVDGPARTPWYAIELVAHDPDGHVVVLTARSDDPPPQAWNDEVEASVQPS